MLSVLFCSRAKGNPDCGLERLLDSTVACTTPDEQKQIEFLIKFDADDDARLPDAFFDKYPFAVKTFVWSRGEGRHGLHHAQEYMFANRDPRSRFCLMTADDFYFSRKGFVSEILAVEDEFCIMGHRRPPIEEYKGRFEDEKSVREWVVSFGCWSPVISSRLIEVCQNFGWQANVDSWLMGLSVALYDLYGVVIWKQHHPFYERGGEYERPASCGTAGTYNNMELTNNVGPLNPYWFELVRRQARNVYLNMTFGTDLRNRGWSERVGVAWSKLRAQPIRRLPVRLARKLARSVSSVF